MKAIALAAALSLASLTPAFAQGIPAPLIECGGSFSGFVGKMKDLAVSRGHARGTVDQFFASVRQDQATLNADRGQGFFQKTFIDFSRSLISSYRLQNGQANMKKWDSVFDVAESRYGVNRGVITAFWAFETDFGGFQGDFNTLNSLMTLSHDCRRPGLFQPQVLAALELFEEGDFSPTGTTGAWAGEIGMVQMLPADIIEAGVDGDGDGHVRLKTSAPDALLSGANMLKKLGWKAGQPWLQEVVVPANLDWSKTGPHQSMPTSKWAQMGVKARNGNLYTNLPGSIILPQGRNGPAFIAYPNFNVYFEWNQSFTYVLTAAYFATRLEGAPVYDARNPEAGLSGGQMKQLQQKLQARGHNVGKIDGILGARTRVAVQKEQARLGLPADAWPTPALLSRL